MKIVGWRAKVEDRQEWNRIVEQTETHPGLQIEQKKKDEEEKKKKEEEEEKKKKKKEKKNEETEKKKKKNKKKNVYICICIANFICFQLSVD